jgi:tetratricopeptide (TPR) repeat protein
MDREVAEAQGNPAAEEWMANSEGYVLAYSGRLQEAREMSGRAEELARGADQKETVALYKTEAASREALFGNAAVARQEALSALRLSRSRDVEYGAAFALALSGESSQIQSFADELLLRFPEDTKVRFAYVPTLRALLALNHNEPSKAIELLDATTSYEGGVRSTGSDLLIGAGTLYPIYVRGLAYLMKDQGSEAAREFQKILDHPGIVLSEPIGAVARLQLARAYDLVGDREKARTAYRDFLVLSKSENTDVPLLRGAKAEYLKHH